MGGQRLGPVCFAFIEFLPHCLHDSLPDKAIDSGAAQISSDLILEIEGATEVEYSALAASGLL